MNNSDQVEMVVSMMLKDYDAQRREEEAEARKTVDASVMEQIFGAFTENVYDLVPDYRLVQQQYVASMAEKTKLKTDLDSINEKVKKQSTSNDIVVDQLDYFKGKFGANFLQKIDKVFE